MRTLSILIDSVSFYLYSCEFAIGKSYNSTAMRGGIIGLTLNYLGCRSLIQALLPRLCYTIAIRDSGLARKSKGRLLKTDINVGIGFATGRKSFQKVLKTNVYNWRECGLTDIERIRLNLFIAYDLKYSNTKASDYTELNKNVLELIDDATFIGAETIQKECAYLTDAGAFTPAELKLFFNGGYAAKRNAILYFSVKKQIDYLVFLDDDEYPIAVTKTPSTVLWGGQHVLYTHLKNIEHADITNGHHCGYISPIPQVEFNNVLEEGDFRLFIEALSNDIINWETIKSVMENGGITYADKSILVSDDTYEVTETGMTKFVSGSNLCINLTDPTRVHPFYNPPKARGEDTFLSTCLSDNIVVRVPCYTFHDAFSLYKPLMSGVLPVSLNPIKADSAAVVTRFYKACIGWIRYKPLLLYITQREVYEEKIREMRNKLAHTLPKVCAYFNSDDFINIATEMEHYHRNVKRHYSTFIKTQDLWDRLQRFLVGNR